MSTSNLRVGWGLWLSVIASIVAVVVTVMQLRAGPSKADGSPAPPGTT